MQSSNPLRRLLAPFRSRLQLANENGDDKIYHASDQNDLISFSHTADHILGQQAPLLSPLLAAVKDYQLTHGSLLKLIHHPSTRDLSLLYTVLARPVGVSLVPTVFPEERFHEAWDLQTDLQELYAKIASDPNLLWDILRECIDGNWEGGGGNGWKDGITSALWRIYKAVRDDEDGFGHVQEWELGLCRGDWMLHIEDEGRDEEHDVSDRGANLRSKPILKQVELNVMATAGASHSQIVNGMHKHLLRTGIYNPQTFSSHPSSPSNYHSEATTTRTTLPTLPPHPKLAARNNPIAGFASALAHAHTLYGPAKSPLATCTAILMLVQHDNFNIADERPLEYALWDLGETGSSVPCFRCEYRDVMTRTFFASNGSSSDATGGKNDVTGRELLFRPYKRSEGGDDEVYEISVIYHRGSLSVVELADTPFPGPDSKYTGFEIRLHLERSRAINCPSVLGQLAAGKRVQQVLSSEAGRMLMERMIGKEQTEMVGERAMRMVWLGDRDGVLRKILDYTCVATEPGSGSGSGVSRAMKMKAAENALAKYVMKPIGADGGGNCVFGRDIPELYVREIAPLGSQAGYILMERIHPPAVKGALISHQGYVNGDVVCELGILGSVLWRRRVKKDVAKEVVNEESEEGGESRMDGKGGGVIEIVRNENVGWTFKSKSEDVREISVVKGYGCFDTPCLVGWEEYQGRAKVGRKDW